VVVKVVVMLAVSFVAMGRVAEAATTSVCMLVAGVVVDDTCVGWPTTGAVVSSSSVATLHSTNVGNKTPCPRRLIAARSRTCRCCTFDDILRLD
jgi:hypothetical protein